MKKLFLSLLVSVLFLGMFPGVTHAEWYDQSVSSWYNRVYNDPPQEIFGERYTAAQVEWIIYSLVTWPISKVLQPDATACLLNAMPFAGTGGNIADCAGIESFTTFFNGIGDGFNTMFTTGTGANISSGEGRTVLSMIFNRQDFSGIGYYRERMSRLNIVSPAYAQEGFGYSRIGGLFRDLWQRSRDMAYSFMVLIIIFMALMIMLRTKVSQQAVATIQWAIPKVATTLIFITFSYAIAGFMIDLMYVTIGIAALLLSTFFGLPTSTMFMVMTEGALHMGIFGFLLLAIPGYVIGIFLAFVTIGTNVAGDVASIFIGGSIGSLLALIFLVILIFAVIFVWFKVTMTVFKTTVMIYLLIVTAPLQIMLGPVVPSMGFGKWLRSLISNLVVFPVIGVLFAFSFAFMVLSINTSLAGLPGPGGDLLSMFPELLNVLPSFSFTGINDGNIGIGEGWPPLLGFSGELGGLILIALSGTLFAMTRKSAELAKGVVAGKIPSFDSAGAELVGTGVTGAVAAKQLYGMTPSQIRKKADDEMALKKYFGGEGNYSSQIEGQIRSGLISSFASKYFKK